MVWGLETSPVQFLSISQVLSLYHRPLYSHGDISKKMPFLCISCMED